MNKIIQGKNKAACGGASTAGGTEDRRMANADRSIQYIIKAKQQKQDRPCGLIEKFLLISNAVGEDHAVPSAEIQNALRFDTIREFRKAVANERQAGALILSNSKGLYLPQPGSQGIPELEKHYLIAVARAYAVSHWLSTVKLELYRRRHTYEIDMDAMGGHG